MTSITQKPPGIPYVILAEDDMDDRFLFRDAFIEIGMSLGLDTVNNGVELMDYLSEVSPLLPQLLFLDLNMPVKNGFECLRELKEDERFKDIPVVIFSTSASPDDVEKCMQLKAHLYVTKPDSFVNLKKVIRKVLVLDFVNHLVENPKEKVLIFSES